MYEHPVYPPTNPNSAPILPTSPLAVFQQRNIVGYYPREWMIVELFKILSVTRTETDAMEEAVRLVDIAQKIKVT